MAVSQIASDNEAGGETAAKALAELIGGKGKVFVVNVKPGISTTDAREQGLRAGAKASRARLPRAQYSNDKSERGGHDRPRPRCRRTPTSRASSPPTCSRPRAPRAASREAGKLARSRSSASTPARSRSRTSRTASVQALIAQKPADIGAQGVEQAVNALTGKPTTKKIGTESTTITKDNLADNQDALYKPSC